MIDRKNAQECQVVFAESDDEMLPDFLWNY